MGFTEGRWEGNTNFPDLTIFVGPDHIKATSGTATLALNSSGSLSLNVGNGQTCVFVASIAQLLRSGVLATSTFTQEQFGTAASQPGPSAVAGTSDAFGFKPGYPPLAAAQLATLGAIQTGAVPKGLKINSVTALYSVAGASLTSIAVGVTKTVFANNGALTVTDLLAKGTNGLSVLATTSISTPRAVPVAITTPVMIPGATTGVEVIMELDFVTAGGGTARLYGFVVNCSYNFS